MKKLILSSVLCSLLLPLFADEAKDYRNKAESGDVVAMRELGRCYEEGKGVTKLKDEAKFWYGKAAAAGDAESYFRMAMMAMPQPGKGKPGAEVVRNLRAAVKLNYAPAYDALGCLYMAGTGLPKDEAQAVECFKKAADADFVDSQFRLGMCYMQGTGVAKDNAKAVEWFTKASAKDHVEATALKGSILLAGEGVEKDEQGGLACLQKAADLGSVMARRNLGIAKLRGLGVEENAEAAVADLRVASAHGDAMALYYLGCCYAEGMGTEKDTRLAGVLLNSALSKGIAKAEPELKKLPEADQVKVDNPLVQITAAAEWGNAEAQYQLARYYMMRLDGEESDAMDADFWMRKSAANGYAPAKAYLEEAAKQKRRANPFGDPLE